MKLLSIISGLLLAGLLPGAERDMARELDEVARAATVMVDGDACQRIVTPRGTRLYVQEGPAGSMGG